VNTAYVDLTLQMKDGPEKVLKAAQDAGIPKPIVEKIPPVPVVPLGFERVPTVDMANAYATFAAEGQQADWYVVQKVTDPSGEVIRDYTPRPERVFSAEVTSNVSAALQAVIESAPAQRTVRSRARRPARPAPPPPPSRSRRAARRRRTSRRRGSSATRRRCPPR
jgi:membrane peptidoglycan carboxypeptidase